MIEIENTSQQLPLPLDQLPPGAFAKVHSVEAKGEIRQRLLEMGFIRGTRIRVERLAPMGDPMELVIRGTHLSLRKEESACILVVPEA
ncbi:MAG: ferrous iron transport protein A [Acidobacteria bacterium]|nr:ferrous iron transport protein A [Acidobacteriota bacterium]